MSKERLTERKEANTAYYFPLCFEKCNGLGASRKCDRCEVISNVCEKLGECEDLEEILRDRLTEEAVNVITASKKDLSEWIDRILWTNKKCDELAREVEQYRDLEEQGLLLRLPVRIRQTLYTNIRMQGWYFRMKDAPYRVEVAFIGLNNDDDMGGGFFNVCYENHGHMMQFNFSDIGKTVFLTQSEAEEKLRELEGK